MNQFVNLLFSLLLIGSILIDCSTNHSGAFNKTDDTKEAERAVKKEENGSADGTSRPLTTDIPLRDHDNYLSGLMCYEGIL